MKTILKLLALVVALATVFTSSMVFTSAEEDRWADDPILTSRDDFDWGAVMHAPSWGPAYSTGNMELQLHQMAEMGCTLLRVDATGNVGALDKTVQLCNAYGIKVMLIVYNPQETYDINAQVDYEAIETHYRTYAQRYDGKHGHGKADYIQIDNEMDVTLMGWAGMGGAGREISEYPVDSLEALSEQMKSAVKGIKNSGADVQSIINIAYVHYGLLKYFHQDGVEWDITGHDWYSDMFNVGNSTNAFSQLDPSTANRDMNYHNSGKELWDLFGKPIIICETNAWANSLNGQSVDETGYPEYFKELLTNEDATFWDGFVYCCEDYYNQPYVIGCTVYEFYDELAHQSGETWLGEAHFGMIETNANGTFKKPKPIYYRLKRMWGGGDVEMIDWKKLDAELNGGDEEEEDSSGGTTGGSTTTVGTATKEEVTYYVTPDPIVITPDPINKEETTVETVYRKVPVNKNDFFTVPMIISLIVGGVSLLVAIAAVIYSIIRKSAAKKVK